MTPSRADKQSPSTNTPNGKPDRWRSLFRRSLEGRFVLDIVRTILQTAVAADVPVHDYLVSVLRADDKLIATHPQTSRRTPGQPTWT